MVRRICAGVMAVLTGLVWTVVAAEQADEASAESLRAWGISGNCIDSRRMRNVRFLDDESAVIRMTGGREVLMTLERRCPGIRSRGFLHETSINKLCTSDPLRVIDTGFVCMIRSFEPYLGEDEADDPEAQVGDDPAPAPSEP